MGTVNLTRLVARAFSRPGLEETKQLAQGIVDSWDEVEKLCAQSGLRNSKANLATHNQFKNKGLPHFEDDRSKDRAEALAAISNAELAKANKPEFKQLFEYLNNIFRIAKEGESFLDNRQEHKFFEFKKAVLNGSQWSETEVLKENKDQVWKSLVLTYFENLFKYTPEEGMAPKATQGFITGLHEMNGCSKKHIDPENNDIFLNTKEQPTGQIIAPTISCDSYKGMFVHFLLKAHNRVDAILKALAPTDAI